MFVALYESVVYVQLGLDKVLTNWYNCKPPTNYVVYFAAYFKIASCE